MRESGDSDKNKENETIEETGRALLAMRSDVHECEASAVRVRRQFDALTKRLGIPEAA